MKTNELHTVYLALGSNLGNKEDNLLTATQLISEEIGTFSAISSMYETKPWGFDSANSFLNSVVCVKTRLNPFELLQKTQELEKKIGRTEKTSHSYKDRIIDIDIILYDDWILKTEELTIPHPLFHQRDFVLKPMAEMASNVKHPTLGKEIRLLLEELETNK